MARRGELRLGEPLAGYTTWRVGGPADRLYRPADLTDLTDFLAELPANEPLLWLGLGSNLLVRDGGFRGTVILLQGALDHLTVGSEGHIQAGAGLSCARLARVLPREGLTGGEFLAGIPGTLGGALALNAGAFGGQTWDWVVRVQVVDRQGQVRTRERTDFQVGYREVRPVPPRQEWFVGVELVFQTAKDDSGVQRIRALLDQRARTQPIGQPSAGSTFRNPPGDHAGRLIEASGLKGLCRGGACISPRHANFIVNNGGATAAAIETLLEEVQQTVEHLYGVQLVPEVHIVGDKLGEGA